MNLRVFVCVLTHFLLSPLGASISVTSPGVTFDLTQAASNGDLFAASSTPADSSSYSLSRMLLTRNADESYSATMVGLVPEKVRLNNEVTGSKDNPAVRVPSYSDNPLVGQHINCLTALKQFPVVAFGSVATEVHAVALIQDVAAGSAALLNKQPFGDALGALAKNIVALEAGPLTRATGDPRSPYISPSFLFAAVTPSDSSYFQGQDGSGIGIALVLPDGILPLDAAGRNSGAQAAAITAAMAQITGTESISNVTALCFNPYLEKLFVALSLEGGGVALMVGSLEVPTRSLQGALINRVAVRDLRFTTSACIVGATGVNVADDWDDNDYIVAVKGADALELQHLGIMNASTGANLAVVSRGDTGVYAVPITTAGMLARKDDMNTAATLGSTDQLLQTTDAAARVGAGSTPDAVTSLMVRGDAVYISCAGTDAGTYGVFVSQALFDRTGSVRAWTPWQPYGAMTDAVHGFALDATGALRYLTGEQDTISTQLWGTGARNSFWGGSSSDDSIGLVTRCNAFFDPLVGGVQSAQSVQGTGGAVDWYNTSPQIGDDSTLLMLTGRNKVLLASTRVSGTVTAGSSFTDDALIYGYDLAGTSAEIGMVTTAAVSRGDSFLTADGWLFIGGSDGIAVLAKSSGTGWGGLSGALDDVSSLDSDYSFRSLLQSDGSSFSQVRQILTDAQAVYVVSTAGVHRFVYNGDAFANSPDELLGEVLIASPTGILGQSFETVLSARLVGDYLFLATTKGLWVNTVALDAVTDTVGDGGWAEVPLTLGGTDSLGVCAELSFMPSSTQDAGGMLSVLTADIAYNIATVYRVNVPTATFTSGGDISSLLAPVQHSYQGATRSYMTLLGRLREHFYTDGGTMIDAGSLHHATGDEAALDVVRTLPIAPSIGTLDAWTEAARPPLVRNSNLNTVSGVNCELATGTLMVIGNWGLQILQ